MNFSNFEFEHPDKTWFNVIYVKNNNILKPAILSCLAAFGFYSLKRQASEL